MYNIREQVSDKAGRKLAVFKASRDMSGRTLTNSEALEMILCALPATEQIIDEQVKLND